jgi:hypothetical protein
MNKYKILFFTFLVILLSCTENDEETNEIVVSIFDFETTIDENSNTGLSLGTVDASTNQGSLTYSIAEQSVDNAIAVNPSTGELTILNESLFDFETNPTITGIVKVENGDISDTADIIINLNNIIEDSLKSVTLNRYNNDNELVFWIKKTFQNERLTLIETSYNSSDIFITTVEYYDNGLIKKKEDEYLYVEYFYDVNNRLIKTISDGGDGPIIRQYIYNGNEIEFIGRIYTNGNPSVHHLELNSENLIYKELIPGINNQLFESVINYQNGNPINVNLYFNGGTVDEYQYDSQSGSDAYNYYQFIYGEHWKNNLLLYSDNFSNGNYRDNVVHYISNSYIIQYKRTYSDNSFFGYNINYDFNSDSLLLKETRNYFGDQQYNYNSKKIELIYEYE